MDITDATLALVLAAKIHGTNKAITTTAKRCAQRLPRSKRYLMFHIMDHPEPLKLAAFIADDYANWASRQEGVVIAMKGGASSY